MNNSKDEKESNPKSSPKDQQKIIQLMHEYNNLKDATQLVLGALAQAKGVSLKFMHETYNLPSGGD